MTLLALWHRKSQRDIYAIADSRLMGNTGKLTDHAPKFTTAQVVCFAASKTGQFDKQVLSRTLAIGYAGSASVAFATIATLQAYLSSLCLKSGGQTPRVYQVCDLAKRILEENFRHFGELWGNTARCDLVIFGFLPADDALKAFHLTAGLAEGVIQTAVNELRLVEEETCEGFGSGWEYFKSELWKDMQQSGNFHPFNLLQRIIQQNERPDVGGYIQVAIANKNTVKLPHILIPQPELGEFHADVSFLGRSIPTVGTVGDCTIGRESVGPDRTALLEIRKKAGY